jgi:hypothetical protein
MATFKVVLDGIELSDESSERISQSIQGAVLQELSGHDASAVRRRAAEPLALSLVPIFKGETLGYILREHALDRGLIELVDKEFGG